MATEFISNSWLMPTNANAESNRLSNYSLDFDGTQLIDLGTIFDDVFTGESWTVSSWIYASANTSYDNFFNRGTAIQFYLLSNKIKIFFSPSSMGIYPLSSIATLSLNTWYNIVFTRSGNENKLYINGSLDNSATSTGSIPSQPTGHLTIGSYGNTGNYLWEGKLTEYSIFDYALSASQVLELYGTGSAIGNPMAITNGRKPVAYYPLGNAAFNSEFLVPNSAEKDYVFDFDASSSNYVNLYNGTAGSSPSQFNIGASDSATFSFWIKSNVTTSNNFFYTQRSATPYLRFYQIYNSGTDSYRVYFVVRDDSSVEVSENSDATNIVNRNQWNHIVGVIDRSASKLYVYVNGVVTGTGTSLGSLGSITQITDAVIGGDPYPSGSIRFEYDGEISNTAIFNTALPATGTESVASLYNYGTPPNIASYSNLQGWWELDASATFDGSNWSIPDASSNSNTGTSSGMTAANLVQSDLIINQSYDPFSLSFDGVNDYILTGSAIDLGTSCSISFWYSGATSGRNGSVVGGRSFAEGGLPSNYQAIFLSAGTYLAFYQSNSATPKTFIYGSSPLNSSDWFHAVIVRDGANLNLYLNGADTSTSYTDLDATAPTYVRNIATNGENQTGSQTITGKISNVSLYNSALSAAQVKTLYNEGKPFDLNTFAVTPVSWWRLGAVNSSFDGTNWTVLDEISTSGNNGVSANMTQADLVSGVGATGSGTSSGMGSGENRKGSAPFSESNSVSYNMSVLAKSTSVPT